MEWTKFQKPKSFSLEYPTGWTVQALPGPTAIVSSPDHQAVVAIQTMRGTGTGDFSPENLIKNGMYTAASLFPGAKNQISEPGPNNSVFGVMSYNTPAGAPGRAQLAFMAQEGGGLLYAIGGPEANFDALEPTLMRIMQSFKLMPMTASEKPVPAMAVLDTKNLKMPLPPIPPAANRPINYKKFTDPQAGSFTIDVPQGWQVRGGLAHPSPGDRRAWIEAISPDGIYILCDPSFPQSFCHFPGQPDGQMTQLAGGVMMNLKPSAERAADCYFKNVAARRYPGVKSIAKHPRPDLVDLVNTGIRKLGIPTSRSSQTTGLQEDLQFLHTPQPLVARILSMAFFNGDYAMGMWAFWNATIYLTIAPPHLAAQADQITLHMCASYENTQRMFQIVQQDEATITAAGQANNAAQWNWFAGQQSVHNAQTAMGNSIVNNYWQTQAANDSLIAGWNQNQAVYDRLSESRSDEILDRQRLVDEGQGKEYAVAAGSNYYWLNPQTTQVVGTDTNTPPDYLSSYTLLKKL